MTSPDGEARPWLRRPNRAELLCLLLGAVLLAQFVVRAELSLVQKSPVWDEQLHLRYGLDLLARGPGDHGRDHPYPVTALLAAASRAGAQGPRSGLELAVEKPAHLWPARRANLALAAFALLLLAGLAWRHLDGRYALALLALGTLDPGWIAQARFVTTDIALGLAFGLAAFGVVWLRRGRLRGHARAGDPRPLAIVAVGLITGFGLTAKFSALLIPALAGLAFLVPLPGERFTQGLPRRLLHGLGAGVAAAAVGLAVYLLVIQLFAAVHGLGVVQGWAHVVDGFANALTARSQPRGVWLLGSYHSHTSFLYFPALLLAKTPLALWALMALAAAMPRGRAFVAEHRLLWLVPGAFLLLAITSRVNLGHRHLTPVLPALWLLGAAGFWALWCHSGRGPYLAGGLAVVLALECLSFHPHYLPATNAAFGGLDGAHRVAVDSASDWGQDLPALKDYLRRHPPRTGPVHLAYFGNANPQAFLGQVVWRPCGLLGAPPRQGQPLAGCRAPAEVLAISATCYVGATGRRVGRKWRLTEQSRCWKWLYKKKPHAILGGTILIFRNVSR